MTEWRITEQPDGRGGLFIRIRPDTTGNPPWGVNVHGPDEDEAREAAHAAALWLTGEYREDEE